MRQCPKCNNKLIGNDNGYTIVGSNKDEILATCDQCESFLGFKKFGTPLFEANKR